MRDVSPPPDDLDHPPPPDEAARRRIRTDLDHTLFIEAGAGAGKTTALVDRVVELVQSGVPITAIAAITFTEKAAAELRHRTRGALSDLDTDQGLAALDDLDHAPIGTLHAFARRLLNEYPIEAGLPPGFGVLDPLESDMNFDEEWEELLDSLLGESDPPGGITEGGGELVDLFAWDGLHVDSGLKQIASAFRWNWDLVHTRVDRSPPPPLRLDVAGIVASAGALAGTHVPPGDTQEGLLTELSELAAQLESGDGLLTTISVLENVHTHTRTMSKRGNKAKWKNHGGETALGELRQHSANLSAEASEQLSRVKTYRKRVAGVICGAFVLDSAARRADHGTLEFHDLLVRARQLIAGDATVRRRLHETYQRILLDEFQDTDPIQLEIAVRLASDPDDPAQSADWADLIPLPGRLFIVGDPKQSIYRFRRADIAQYLRTAPQLGADTEQLTANFRSTEAVIDFTNVLFGSVISESEDTQPAFRPLSACRSPHALDHGSVTVLGADCHLDLAAGTWEGETGNADELRRREAVEVVGAVTTALAEGWLVENNGQLRSCRHGDICILLPTRLSLAALERELRAARVPYRAENSSIVYASQEIRDLLLTLKAADDPTDELALVASLRSPLYGCSDVELWEWKRAGGGWGLWHNPPEGFDDHRVARGITHIRSLNARITTSGVADLLAELAEERRSYDVALDRADARDIWHRLRFVIDQARAWADAGGRGLRRYLNWAHRQASEGQISEAILPEDDRDAVRLMTVHAAKGLEFPITVVSGLTTRPSRRRGVEVTWEGGGWQLTGKGDDGSFAEIAPLDELMSDAERRRLLYVACTRAVDHLVVSLHRARIDDDLGAESEDKLTAAELMSVNGAAEAPAVDTSRTPAAQPVEAKSATTQLDLDDISAWRHELNETLTRAGRRHGIAATRLAEEVITLGRGEEIDDAGLDKHPVNIDLPPWQRGRYGTSIGRAVHGTLQFCDLESGTDIETLALSQCAAEGILGLSERVSALAHSAIQAPIVRQVVAGAPHWRELFVAAPIGDRVLEGYIDLLVRTPEGLTIVDYKTDQWSGSTQIAERVGRYRIQLAAYGAALRVALGEPVIGGILVRCRAGEPAEQIEIHDWEAALSEVARLVR